MIDNLKMTLQNYWQEKGFEQATPIQTLLAQAMEKQESLIGISPTGSGKTLAYLLPILNKIEANHQLQAMIIVPSQELAIQVGQVAQEWAQVGGVTAFTILGGANFKRQEESLKQKPELLVATPGRLLEFLTKSKKLKLHQVTQIVFDEADYLLDEEHMQQVEAIRKKVLRDTRCVWVSATFGQGLQALQANENLNVIEPDKLQTQLNIEHVYVLTQNRQKVSTLKALASVDEMRAMVFFEQIHELELVASKLIYQGVSVVMLHSQLSKLERQQALQRFNQRQATFMLTTDVSARGIDIAEVDYVIHYNRVDLGETYTHRSGRTGRMGRPGTVISLVNEQEQRDLEAILDDLSLELHQRFVYNRQLVSQTDYLLMRKDNQLAEQETNKKIKKPQKSTKNSKMTSKIKTSGTSKPKKKKVRTKDAKNKGKRKSK